VSQGRGRQRPKDILQAISAINAYIARGTLDDGLVLDAVSLPGVASLIAEWRFQAAA
jgi:hypothetical protein